MKKKDLVDMRKKNTEDLAKMVSEKRAELAKITTDIKIAREANLKKAKNMKYDIAQLLTVIKEKEFTEKTK